MPTSRYLYIVVRTQPVLFELLRDRFAGDPKVTVIFDRRHGERRLTGDSLEAAERRQRDRRRNLDVQDALRDRAHAVVSIPS
jgi:hypothetical protein